MTLFSLRQRGYPNLVLLEPNLIRPISQRINSDRDCLLQRCARVDPDFKAKRAHRRHHPPLKSSRVIDN
ncbi:hypothetical protein EUGRSUZ_J00507 [Eucalyptus grandis]|uniref:Uncharacterized protein n=2 Tax=Eucalyptus grandis TaxID=71139 RepID=A0ACC3J4U3_EUCGR|nr:hypothetical protein EUGRSUZ_J00507 [Eucalyptus grandis]